LKGVKEGQGVRRLKDRKLTVILFETEFKSDLDQWKLPQKMRGEALRKAYDDSRADHLRIDKTHQRLVIAYYWLNMFCDIVEYVRRCDIYQRTKVT